MTRKKIHEFISRFALDYAERKKILLEQGLMPYLLNSAGYVLIIVLVSTALLVSVSGEFIVRAQTNIGYVKKFDHKQKALYLARSGVELSKNILKADKAGISAGTLSGKTADKNIDSYNDLWALDYPELPIGDGFLKIKIEDENAKINLSVLANEAVVGGQTPYYAILQRFFINMGLSMDLADAIVDWVDIDNSPMPYGAESDYYRALMPPYAAKNSAMDSIDELLLVKGFTPETYYGLGGGNAGLEQNLVDDNKGDISLDPERIKKLLEGSPASDKIVRDDEKQKKIGKEKSRRLPDYFRVNGDRFNWTVEWNKININTASYRVLSSLSRDMTDDLAAEIINRRQGAPFKTIEEAKDLIPDKDDTVQKNIITVKSYLFRITAEAQISGTRSKIVAVYNRESAKVLYWSEE